MAELLAPPNAARSSAKRPSRRDAERAAGRAGFGRSDYGATVKTFAVVLLASSDSATSSRSSAQAVAW